MLSCDAASVEFTLYDKTGHQSKGLHAKVLSDYFLSLELLTKQRGFAGAIQFIEEGKTGYYALNVDVMRGEADRKANAATITDRPREFYDEEREVMAMSPDGSPSRSGMVGVQ